MKNAIVDFLNNLLQINQDKMSKFLYWYLNRKIADAPDVCFLNYGYAPMNGEHMELRVEDEAQRMYIQLYDSVLAARDLSGLDVLEMSCGRGGGANYITRYKRPRSMCGVDRQMGAVRFCSKQHTSDALRFLCGDAQRMPFGDESFDVVVNIEASHDYPHLDRFFAEVRRVLRPGGYLLYADFRNATDCAAWRRYIDSSRLDMVEEADITPNVLKGLELNTEHNAELVRKLCPWPLRPVFKQFAGLRGTCIFERFQDRRSRYLRYVLRKADPKATAACC